MATTGELRAIIELLELVDIGDAASYLGEETLDTDTCMSSIQEEQDNPSSHIVGCSCISCQILRS